MPTPPPPHFLLYSDASKAHDHWRFVLKSRRGERMLEASDHEPTTTSHRLDLLAVVRGLEALDQPSRVTLVSRSPYVARGIRYGLRQWREDGWCWEKFGEMTPIKNVDLWQRVDRAMQYHHVEFRSPRMEGDDLSLGTHLDPGFARRHPRPTRRRSSEPWWMAAWRTLMQSFGLEFGFEKRGSWASVAE